MKKGVFILVLSLLACLSCSKKNEMIEPVLKELDETIDNRQRFENEKQDLIRPYLANATGEDQEIQDLPASWSNNRWYRIMEDGSNNWFRIKCSVLSAH